jgi:hypothetical protein
MLAADAGSTVTQFPALITYFRQGRLDKFFLAYEGAAEAVELDFFAAAQFLKPNNTSEKRQSIPLEFYRFLESNKRAFTVATQPSEEDVTSQHRGSANDVYILKRLKAREVRSYHGFTEGDEEYIQQVIQRLNDGAIPRPTTKKVAEALKKELQPLKVLGILRRDIPSQLLQPTRAQRTFHALSPREVILSSYLLGTK